jgi:hypothetical protein
MSKNILIYGRQVSGIKSSVAVSRRNAEILAKDLNADLLQYDKDKLQNKYYDVIILTYSNRYTDFETLKKLIKKDGKQIRIGIKSEYEEVGYNRPYFMPYIEITNFEGGQNFLNTNLLIAKEPNKLIKKKYDCIYYSRHRADRMKYCKEYLQGDIYLSTHPKNHKHFFHAGCNPKLIKHIDWTPKRETLNLFRYSLYIEDVYTHSVFNNLANRWYEAGFCNNVIFFDVNCWGTIRKSEIAQYENEIENYIVSSYNELQDKINDCNKDFEYHLKIQKGWRVYEMKHRADMINKLKEIINQ